MNWQTPIALSIVALAAIFFLLSARKKKKSCGNHCACPKNSVKYES